LGAVPGEYYRADDVDGPPPHHRRQLRDRRWGIPFVEGAAWQIAKFRNVCVNPRNHSIAATERPGSFQRALVTLARRRRRGGDRQAVFGNRCVAIQPRPLCERFVGAVDSKDRLITQIG
jgi:hypothetical protein